MQRIEVELQPWQQRQAACRDDARHSKDRIATPREKPIERTKRGVAHGSALPRRSQKRHQRGKQADAGDERDNHAGTGNHAQLGHAAILGRQESVEARRDRGGGKRQRDTDLSAGFAQREMQIVARVALGAIAHAELDSEVDTQADKEHGKGDRDQIQRAQHDETECRRDDQSDAEAQQDRSDQTPGPKRDPQQQRYRNQHDRDIERDALGKRRELLVGERYRARLPYPDPWIGVESKLARSLPNRPTGTFARLQRAVVEYRLHEDEAAQLARFGSAPGDQRVPGKCRHTRRSDAVEGVGDCD